MSTMRTPPHSGNTCLSKEFLYPDRVDGFTRILLAYHASAISAKRTRERAGSTHSPRSFEVSTVARKPSASRFVRNPRLSVWVLSGRR
jgi:hypothetical protein